MESARDSAPLEKTSPLEGTPGSGEALNIEAFGRTSGVRSDLVAALLAAIERGDADTASALLARLLARGRGRGPIEVEPDGRVVLRH